MKKRELEDEIARRCMIDEERKKAIEAYEECNRIKEEYKTENIIREIPLEKTNKIKKKILPMDG